MVESRCGLICSQCAHRIPKSCSGCVAMAKPFWGDSCPVKSCCEDKGLEHCGACKTFPCALLEGFAYDKQQGDEGARIAQCQKWREE